MRRYYRTLALAVLVLFSTQAIAADKDTPPPFDVGGIKVVAWLPNDEAPKPWPAIIFSHGFHGCNTQSVFLMEALSNAGYAVFAPNHKDATCNGGGSSWLGRSEAGFRDASGWSDKTYLIRRQDIETLLNDLPKNPRFARSVDWSRVGLAGHSLGGYTVLAMAGAWPSWKDPRIKAVLALSPYSEPFADRRTLGSVSVPIMYQGGTRDFGITPGVEKQGGVYDQTPAPKYFVDIDGAGHFGFADVRDQHHDVMAAYGVAFFNTYLKGKPFPKELMHKGEGVAELKIQASTESQPISEGSAGGRRRLFRFRQQQ